MEQLTLGRSVNLAGDPTQDAVDRFGRSLFYVDRDDGLDIGQEMIRAGWADVFVFERDFQRVSSYRDAADDAEFSNRGVWPLCGGDFHFSRADELRERRLSAVEFVDDYYRSITRRRFVTAWGMLAARQRRQIGPFRRWKAGHRRTLGVSVLASRARLS